MEKPLSPPEMTQDFRDKNPALATWLEAIPDLLPHLDLLTATIDPTSIAAGEVSRQSFTVDGIDEDDTILIRCPSLPSSLEMLASYRVTATDTIEIPFWNSHATDAIDAGNLSITVFIVR